MKWGMTGKRFTCTMMTWQGCIWPLDCRHIIRHWWQSRICRIRKKCKCRCSAEERTYPAAQAGTEKGGTYSEALLSL